jgi:hypothetical protein
VFGDEYRENHSLQRGVGSVLNAFPAAVDLGSSERSRIGYLVTIGLHQLNNDTINCWGLNDQGNRGQGDVVYRGDNAGEMGNNLPALSF